MYIRDCFHSQGREWLIYRCDDAGGDGFIPNGQHVIFVAERLPEDPINGFASGVMCKGLLTLDRSSPHTLVFSFERLGGPMPDPIPSTRNED